MSGYEKVSATPVHPPQRLSTRHGEPGKVEAKSVLLRRHGKAATRRLRWPAFPRSPAQTSVCRFDGNGPSRLTRQSAAHRLFS